MAIDTVKGMEWNKFDFVGDTMPVELHSHVSGTAAAVAMNATGGLVAGKGRRATTIQLYSGTADDAVATVSHGTPRYFPYNGKACMETRFLVNAATAHRGSFAMNAGLYSEPEFDDSTLAVTLSDAGLAKGDASAGQSFVGIVIDTDKDDNPGAGVKFNAYAAIINNGQLTSLPLSRLLTDVNFTYDTWYSARVELTPTGNRDTGMCRATITLQTEFHPGGERFFEYWFDDVCPNTVGLTPIIGVQSRLSSRPHSMVVDCLNGGQARGV